MLKNHKMRLVFTISNLILVVLLTQCTLPISSFLQNPTAVSEPTQSGSELPTPQQVEPKVEITFRVQVPAYENSSQIYLDLLDEVTGLALNSKRFPMELIGDQLYETRIAFNQGSLVKYRYTRDGNPIAIEHTSIGAQVRYRLFNVENPAEVTDIVAAWSDVPYQGQTGRILGQIRDVSNNPIPDILVTAGGVGTISSSDGTFLLEGVTPGTHNLIAYSLNGDYLPYQQGALVAANSTTPASLTLPPTNLVNITFNLTLPEDSVEGLPIRIIGNIYSLGNTFSNLPGGTSITASRAPYLVPLDDGRYSVTLSLPAGLDLRYKYTLGDGFWNTEHRSDGSFRTRQLIVPDHDQTVEDTVSSWKVGDFDSVIFQLEIPQTTPKTDVISIQFNPFAWTQPVQMWPTGNNQWMYILQSPLHLLSTIDYRYCRNEQCDVAEPAAVVGSLDSPVLDTSELPAVVADSVLQWSWMDLLEGETKIVGKDVNPRGEAFTAGVELLAYYEPNYQPYYSNAFHNIKSIGANWTILTPTWHFSSSNPPVLEAVPGKDPLWYDLTRKADAAKNQGLSTAIFPQSIPTANSGEWWLDAERDGSWWQSWFDRYRIFLLHFADFAEQSNSEALILGEKGMLPGLPGGILPNGDPSNAPVDAETRWEELVSEIRSRFHGELLFAVQDPTKLETLSGFLKDFDAYYVLISSALEDKDGNIAIEPRISTILDDQIYPFWETTSKPVIIGIKYPSTTNAVKGCIPSGAECLPFDLLDQPVSTTINTPLDLQIQFDIYEAFLSAINERDWILGFVSRGYYPPVELQDLSSSVHGKPTSALLWYWYPRFLIQP